jgi:hypothetical protein
LERRIHTVYRVYSEEEFLAESHTPDEPNTLPVACDHDTDRTLSPGNGFSAGIHRCEQVAARASTVNGRTERGRRRIVGAALVAGAVGATVGLFAAGRSRPKVDLRTVASTTATSNTHVRALSDAGSPARARAPRSRGRRTVGVASQRRTRRRRSGHLGRRRHRIAAVAHGSRATWRAHALRPVRPVTAPRPVRSSRVGEFRFEH